MLDHVAVCRKVWEQKAVVDRLKAELEAASKKLTAMKFDAIKLLDAQGLTKQHLPGMGTLFVQTKFSVKVPKDITAKYDLYDYVDRTYDGDVRERVALAVKREKFTVGELLGPTLLGLLSIHSQTLNSFWSSELEAAKERGDVRWALPGVGEPEIFKEIRTRKE